ncbi:MAG: RNA methyltransferase [Candidatus Omnitrophota bacterium]
MKKISNSQLKKIKEFLRDRKARDSEGLFVVEGMKIVKDAFAKRHKINFVVVSDSFVSENEVFVAELEAKSITVFKSAERDFEKISSLQNSQGIAAIIDKPGWGNIRGSDSKYMFVVLCDGVQDPGNLGTIIRVSAAFGADFVLLTGKGVDIYNPKVVRASSGAILDIPVYECNAKDLDSYKKKGYSFLISSVQREKSKDLSVINNFSRPLIVVFGSEGKGVSKEIKSRADGYFYIPISRKVESLNVSAAAAITLYELTRKWKKFV